MALPQLAWTTLREGRVGLRVTTKPATHSEAKAVHRSDLKPVHRTGGCRPAREDPRGSGWVMSCRPVGGQGCRPGHEGRPADEGGGPGGAAGPTRGRLRQLRGGQPGQRVPQRERAGAGLRRARQPHRGRGVVLRLRRAGPAGVGRGAGRAGGLRLHAVGGAGVEAGERVGDPLPGGGRAGRRWPTWTATARWCAVTCPARAVWRRRPSRRAGSGATRSPTGGARWCW